MSVATELTDREKVEGLRGLVIVELASALDMRSELPNIYADGRIASYEFVLDAIDRRWPDAPYDWRALVAELADRMGDGEDRASRVGRI